MKNFSKMRQGLSCMVMALLLMLIPADIFAQNSISVSGIVMDDTNEPVIMPRRHGERYYHRCHYRH